MHEKQTHNEGGNIMFRRINKNENSDNRWPCIICDEWAWDVLS